MQIQSETAWHPFMLGMVERAGGSTHGRYSHFETTWHNLPNCEYQINHKVSVQLKNSQRTSFSLWEWKQQHLCIILAITIEQTTQVKTSRRLNSRFKTLQRFTRGIYAHWCKSISGILWVMYTSVTTCDRPLTQLQLFNTPTKLVWNLTKTKSTFSNLEANFENSLINHSEISN